MINEIFDLCVRLLVSGANLLGMTYKEINVWIFCVVWPIVTLLLVVMVLIQYRTIRRLNGRIASMAARELFDE
jgi:hypothetical protein